MTIMGEQPHDYIINSAKSDWEAIDHFVHRTFNTIDLLYCLQALQHLVRAVRRKIFTIPGARFVVFYAMTLPMKMWPLRKMDMDL